MKNQYGRSPLPGETSGAPRAEAEQARSRLLHAGLRLFANQGYAKTSVRELAEAASVNVAAVSYYFGDKAGLYRSVLTEPQGVPDGPPLASALLELPLADALRLFYAGFLEPLKQGDIARLCMKLHFREMVEPTGLWQDDSAHGIKPLHDLLLSVLGRHLGLGAPDSDLQRLAICIAGLGVHLHVGLDVIDQIAPGLHATPASVDLWSERLVEFALAMVDAESRRRVAMSED